VDVPKKEQSALKRLSVLGYAPAEKEAWPFGGLPSRLEPLDPRHGAFNNHIMTPLMATVCFLKGDERLPFIDQVLNDILADASTGGVKRRFNVLDRNTDTSVAAVLDDRVRGMLHDGPDSIEPTREVWLTIGRPAISALVSHLIEGRNAWSKLHINTFNRQFFGVLMRQFRERASPLTSSPGVPDEGKGIAQIGVYFRLCESLSRQEARDTLSDSIAEYRRLYPPDQAHDEVLDSGRVVAILESLVPLPHDEIYRSYKVVVNPIGFRQDIFLQARDQAELRGPPASPGTELFWRRIGQAIAARLRIVR
jgi:hypothetical protein